MQQATQTCPSSLSMALTLAAASAHPPHSSRMVSEPVLPRIHAILQKESVREFLAEFLSTYVMMVSEQVAQCGWGPAMRQTGGPLPSAPEVRVWGRSNGKCGEGPFFTNSPGDRMDL